MNTDSLPFPAEAPPPIWTPCAPPSLEGCHKVALDVETTGLKWWDGDKLIGIGITTEKGSQYLPVAHRGGGNLDPAVVRRWAQQELRGKHVVNLNTRFDLHFLRTFGIDLEAQGCSVSDVAHSAALLDDHRTRFSLDRLSRDFLGQEKIGKDLDASRMADYHAGTVAPRAIGDTRQVWDLESLFSPRLDREGLQRVKLLENSLIYVVVEMERNGSPIDVELLDRWVTSSEQDYLRGLWNIYRDTRLGSVNPESPKDLEKVFLALNLPITETPEGRPSFTDSVLASHQHPVLETIRQTRKISSLRSKFLLKYREAVGADGVLRYALHQLRSDTYGTVSGRFSSSALVRGVGVNIQQTPSADKQHGEPYIIRQLHRPASGEWLSADADQIEYRLFAHFAQNPTVIKAYQRDPTRSFHHMVWQELRRTRPDLPYKTLKALNFCRLYGGGPARIARMLEMITEDQLQHLQTTNAGPDHPYLTQAMEVIGLYDRVLPEVKKMLLQTADTAKSQGYVQTLLGRKCRLAQGHTFKALNRLVQGTAADYMKLKLVELHQQRASTGLVLRFTVHDEIDGDCPDPHCREAVSTLLNTQSLDLSLPLLWSVSTGPTWGEV